MRRGRQQAWQEGSQGQAGRHAGRIYMLLQAAGKPRHQAQGCYRQSAELSCCQQHGRGGEGEARTWGKGTAAKLICCQVRGAKGVLNCKQAGSKKHRRHARAGKAR